MTVSDLIRELSRYRGNCEVTIEYAGASYGMGLAVVVPSDDPERPAPDTDFLTYESVY